MDVIIYHPYNDYTIHFLGGDAPVEPFPWRGPGLLAEDEAMGCARPPESRK